MNSIELQKSVRNNASEASSSIGQITNWEKAMKDKEMKFLEERKRIKEAKEEINSSEAAETPTISADTLKSEGNEAYQSGQYGKALEKYTEALGIQPTNHILHANKAMVYLKLEQYKQAQENCTRAIKLDSTYIKAYLRRATAFTKLKKVQEAIEDYENVLKLEPTNKSARNEMEKLLKQQNNKKTSPLASKKEKPVNSEQIKYTNQKKASLPSTAEIVKLQAIKKSTTQKGSMKKIPVTFVKNREEAEMFFNPPSSKTEDSSSKKDQITEDKSIIHDKKEMKIELPKRKPRTSHQFAQDWSKVSKDKNIAKDYLMSIPTSFISSIEVEIETVAEIASLLTEDFFDVDLAGKYLQALTESRRFSIAMAFLSPEQKQVFKQLLQKLANETKWDFNAKLEKYLQ